MKLEEWKKFLAEGEQKNEGREISYSDVRQEYDAILAFLKQDILQKSGGKYVADALEMLANDVRDEVHSPNPHDKENYAYFDRESGTQPNLSEMPRPDGRTRPSQVVPSRSGKEQYYLKQQNRAKGAAMALLDASEEFAQMPSTETASSVSSFVGQQANIIVDAMVALERFITDSGPEGLEEFFGKKKKPAKLPQSSADILELAVQIMTRPSESFPADNGLNYTIWGPFDSPYDRELKQLGLAFTKKLKDVAGEHRAKEQGDGGEEAPATKYEGLTREQIDKVIALVIKESRKKDE